MSNETPAEMTTASLSAMKLPELKALAASRGLKGISQLRKPQLIELLSNDASAPTTPAAAPRDEAGAVLGRGPGLVPGQPRGPRTRGRSFGGSGRRGSPPFAPPPRGQPGRR